MTRVSKSVTIYVLLGENQADNSIMSRGAWFGSKNKKSLQSCKNHANVSMYRGLHGNLRLWTVQELVSRFWLVRIQSIQVEAGIFSI
ncbi:MAG: hypothetical protein K2H93_09855 [Oscillospiraceae bacterium]|nr:hypothetical protein [Oscillospiraceae bacterium]